jgi:serine/threonine protein phosphatase PrpC
MLDDDAIERALATDDEQAVRDLFTAAMHAGGADNISIIVASVAPGS